MSTKPRFDLRDIQRYLWNGPARIRQTLAEQGPAAASRAARYYSLALLLTTIAIYFLMACVLGFFQVAFTAGGKLNLADPRVLVFVILAGAALLSAILSAFWAAGLGISGLFRSEEAMGSRVSAALWGVALIIFYAGFVSGVMGSGG